MMSINSRQHSSSVPSEKEGNHVVPITLNLYGFPSFPCSAWERTVAAQRPFAQFPRRAWERESVVRKNEDTFQQS